MNSGPPTASVTRRLAMLQAPWRTSLCFPAWEQTVQPLHGVLRASEKASAMATLSHCQMTVVVLSRCRVHQCSEVVKQSPLHRVLVASEKALAMAMLSHCRVHQCLEVVKQSPLHRVLRASEKALAMATLSHCQMTVVVLSRCRVHQCSEVVKQSPLHRVLVASEKALAMAMLSHCRVHQCSEVVKQSPLHRVLVASEKALAMATLSRCRVRLCWKVVKQRHVLLLPSLTPVSPAMSKADHPHCEGPPPSCTSCFPCPPSPPLTAPRLRQPSPHLSPFIRLEHCSVRKRKCKPPGLGFWEEYRGGRHAEKKRNFQRSATILGDCRERKIKVRIQHTKN